MQYMSRSPVPFPLFHATLLIYFPSWNFHPWTIKYQDSLMLCPKLCSHSICSLVNLSFANSFSHNLYANGSQNDISSPSFSTPDLTYFTSPLGFLINFSSSTCSRLNWLSSCSKLALFHCSLDQWLEPPYTCPSKNLCVVPNLSLFTFRIQYNAILLI